ncbi:MAG: AAA family ATPase [Cyanobacteria bacterium P01_F01_bin.13]
MVVTEYVQGSLTSVGSSTSEGIQLTEQQSVLVSEVLEWLETRSTKFGKVSGYAGSGKSWVTKYAVNAAIQRKLLNGDIWACAPTHQAKRVLEESLGGSSVHEVSTLHSVLGLRPSRVKFESHHRETLAELLSIPIEERTEQENHLVDGLSIRRNAADEGMQAFMPTKFKVGISAVRLLIVDEWSMIDKTLYGLLCELIANPDMHPDLQVLFLGDPAQLPPIGECVSEVNSINGFSQLTQVVRYSGSILEYCNKVREVPDYEWLHQKVEQDDTLLVLNRWEIMSQLKDLYADGESVRFVSATNARVTELNYEIRSILKEGAKGLFYEPGDVVLTLNAVSRQGGSVYDVACQGKNSNLVEHTSTLLELGEPCVPGDLVGLGKSDATRLSKNSFTFRSELGTEFERLIFRYRPYDSDEAYSVNKALCLINPDQFTQWQAECKQLLSRARSTQSRSRDKKMSRGQTGDQAKQVWSALGLKDWWTWAGSNNPVTAVEYQQIKRQLWIDYFSLLGFADKASYSYCSTAHRVQGSTVDIVVIDMASIISGVKNWAKQDGTWDTRKLLYTAATRARKQIVFMV